ncbi:AT-hook motif nuclear-localized protein 10 [Eucalyptus grandis]|uniref:AT-hook motif nuclear-localized protein 10 n=1 Tax=Eucalyptus grandis TaxID=71139 RepID=UPI00192EE20A|nr:AT-hook motif nuclear-localized protein 10 [Eucalyptus grandis]
MPNAQWPNVSGAHPDGVNPEGQKCQDLRQESSQAEETLPGGSPEASLPSQPVVQNMRLAFSPDGTAVYKPAAAASPSYKAPSAAGNGGPAEAASADGGGPAAALPHGINMNVGAEPAKKKRGRPRKYGPDGTIALGLTPAAPPSTVAPPGGGSPRPTRFPWWLPGVGGRRRVRACISEFVQEERRPPGSSNKKRQLETLGSLGIGFTPHVITVKAGEDVSSKIMSFSQHGPRAVCILSANGAISNVTLRQPAISGGTVTYEGRFEILSLSGSFLLSESDGHRSRTGGLSVSLSGPDGRVLGGGVAGLLTAASPVQVIVGSFIADGRKESKANHAEPFLGTARIGSSGGFTGASSPSHGTLSESSGGPGSPLNQSTGACTNSTPQAMSIVPVPWK